MKFAVACLVLGRHSFLMSDSLAHSNREWNVPLLPGLFKRGYPLALLYLPYPLLVQPSY